VVLPLSCLGSVHSLAAGCAVVIGQVTDDQRRQARRCWCHDL